MKHLTASTSPSPFSGENWFDPLEDAIRFRVRAFIEAVVAEEAQAALGGRARYQRSGAPKGYRNGHRHRQLVGTFGALTVSLPRVRLLDGDGGEKEWRSQTIQAYKRPTKRAEAIIANTYLAGTNTRRVRRALAGLFGGKVGKDAVSRAWRKVKTDRISGEAMTIQRYSVNQHPVQTLLKANDKGFLSNGHTVQTLLEGASHVHHVFPRNYLKKSGLARSRYNQIANYVVMQGEINIAIGDDPPTAYFGALWRQCENGKARYGGITDADELRTNLVAHCIPHGSGAWSGRAGRANPGRDRRTGCSRNRRDERRGIPPTRATGSRRADSTRDAAAASREAAGDRAKAPAAARIP